MGRSRQGARYMRRLLAVVVVVVAASTAADDVHQLQDDTAVSLLESSDGVALTVVPGSVLRAIRHIKKDRAKAKRREKVTADVKKATKAEKAASKKQQHIVEREVRRDEKQERKQIRKKAKRKEKKYIKKAEKSKGPKGQTKNWTTVVKSGIITAKGGGKKPKKEKTYDAYTSVVRKAKAKKKKKKKDGAKKPIVDSKPVDASRHCANCKSRCKTAACKTWCG